MSRFLYIQTDLISMRDLPEAFVQLGYDVVEINYYSFTAQKYKQDECDALKEIMDKNSIDYAITYDFIECVAQACYETNCKYIAWVYDCPQKELFTMRALYPTNYIFVFDKLQKKELENIGIDNVFHEPLCVSEQKVKIALEHERVDYIADISFVGQLYGIDGLERIMSNASELIRNELMQVIEKFFLNWDNLENFGGYASENVLNYFDLFENHKIRSEAPLMSIRLFYEAAVLARIIAREERVAIINSLAMEYYVNLYTRDKNLDDIDENVHVINGVGYDKAVYRVYRDTKINLNITLHCIESGVPQRVFDVLAAGGFLITNYQKELEELFEIGEELVVFRNYQELKILVEYYIDNEEERRRIACNGQRKVFANYTYNQAVKKIIDTITNG